MSWLLEVHGLSGTLCEVSVDQFWAVANLKAAVEFETEIPQHEQRLLLGTLELRDSESLEPLLKSARCGITLIRMQRPPEQADWLCRVQEDGLKLRSAPPSVRGDAVVVLAAVRANGLALEFAALELRADLEIVMSAVQENGWAVHFAAKGLQTHPEVQLVAHRKMRETVARWVDTLDDDGLRLQEAPAYLRAEREVVLAAVIQNGRALRFASSELQGDRDVVQASVQEHGRALRYAPAPLQADSDLVTSAVKTNGFALEFASDSVRDDRRVVLAAVQLGGEDGAAVLAFASDELRRDREVLLAAIRHSTNFALLSAALLRAGASIRADREVIHEAVCRNGGLLALASDELRNDLEIALAAVRQSRVALAFVGRPLLRSPEFAEFLGKRDGS